MWKILHSQWKFLVLAIIKVAFLHEYFSLTTYFINFWQKIKRSKSLKLLPINDPYNFEQLFLLLQRRCILHIWRQLLLCIWNKYQTKLLTKSQGMTHMGAGLLGPDKGSNLRIQRFSICLPYTVSPVLQRWKGNRGGLRIIFQINIHVFCDLLLESSCQDVQMRGHNMVLQGYKKHYSWITLNTPSTWCTEFYFLYPILIWVKKITGLPRQAVKLSPAAK